MIKFFRNVRKSKVLPIIVFICFVIFASYKLGELFSHSIRIDYAQSNEAKSVDEDRPEPWVETLSWKPRVQVMHNLLTVKECEEIIALGEPKLTKSQVVGDNGENVESDVRTSHGLFFNEDYMKDSPLLRSVEYRIAKWTQIPKENGESFYLLRYELGQQYVAHVDYFGQKDRKNIGHSGDRIATVLVYLRTPEEGGETQFPNAENGEIKVPPIAGDAVLFYDYKPDGAHDPLSEHAGLPVIKGTKFSITKWMRSSETEFSWLNAFNAEQREELKKQDIIYEKLHGLHFIN